jgi:hypothetical protein
MRDSDYNDLSWNRKGSSWYGDTVTWDIISG